MEVAGDREDARLVGRELDRLRLAPVHDLRDVVARDREAVLARLGLHVVDELERDLRALLHHDRPGRPYLRALVLDVDDGLSQGGRLRCRRRAAQLYTEFRTLFPDNAVRYFVSYYDYYQPEAYVPSTDTYIEKDASINDEIDKMRHAATKALLERNDVVVVASVSCIYGLGSPASYFDMLVYLDRGGQIERDTMLRKLVDMQYQRSDYDFHRGTFRVRGDVVEIFPAYEEAKAIRVELFGDTVENLCEIDPLRGRVLRKLERVAIYPASHYVANEEVMKRAVETVRSELEERLGVLRVEQKLLEAQRLEQRTRYDLELLAEMGFCPGIENYSRHLDVRE